MTTIHEPIFQILDRLKSSQKPYVITGSRASFQYHRWLYPVPKIVVLRIYSDDHDYWVNLLRSESIYVSETPPTTEMMKSFQAAVLLAKNLNEQICQNKRIFADLRYESPEDLCIGLLTNLTTETPIMEFLAILLMQRCALQWEYFCKRIMTLSLTREAGILLEVINEHTQQNFMPQRVIDQLFQSAIQSNVLTNSYFPHTWRVRLALKRQNEKDLAITYPRTTRKWGVKVVLPRYIMDKLVLDLDYAWRTPKPAADSDFNNRQVLTTSVE